MIRYVVYEFMRDGDGNTFVTISPNVYQSLRLAEKELKTKRDDIADEIENNTGEPFKEQTEYIIDYDDDDGLSISKDDSLYIVDIAIHKMTDGD